MTKFDETKQLKCSFCGKPQSQVRRLVAGASVYICDECIELCQEIINEEFAMTEEGKEEDITLLTPKEIDMVLSDYVIGQDDAKKALAVAVYNHYKRILSKDDKKKRVRNSKSLKNDKYGLNLDDADFNNKMNAQQEEDADVEIQKSNIVMIGPTGSGKTLLAQTLAKILNVPFAIADATTLTEAGYVGEDVENILLKLIQAADYDIERAQKGIIYIDEIDKISRKSENPSITRDVSGEGVQQALLKIIEGTVANVPPQGGRKHPHQDFLQIDTSDILFICGGAFDGLDTIIQRRIGEKIIGFNSDIKSSEAEKSVLIKQIQPGDLLKYGLIPEFIGRLPVMVTLEELDKEALVRIIKEPKNAIIKQYKKLFLLDGVELEIEEDAIERVAEKAIERKTGARGLRSILENVMTDIMYEIPSRDDIKKCIITKATIDNNKGPTLMLTDSREGSTKEESVS